MTGRSARRAAGWLVVAVLLFGAGWWASIAIVPAEMAPNTQAERPVTVAVRTETLRDSMSAVATAVWPTADPIRSPSGGVITSVDVAPGGEVRVGSILATVDLQPIVVAQGPVPAFRTLEAGVEGPDVKQLQRSLQHLGHWPGRIDGVYSQWLATSVKSWQRSQGIDPSGAMPLGSVVFIDVLPSRIMLSPEIQVGAALSPGQPVGTVLAQEPTFALELSEVQMEQMPPNPTVTISAGEQTWTATAGTVGRKDTETPEGGEESGSYLAPLNGADGRPVCGDGCGLVPIDKEAQYPVEILIQPEVTGTVVPVAALTRAPDGKVSVLDERGDRRVVQVLAEVDGFAAVSGLDAIDRVRVTAPHGTS